RLLVADHHNTNTLSFSSTTLTFNRRKSLPYGGQRGAAPAFWPGQKGFVGGDIDTTTGLTHIGAREYDSALGQFISVDPVLAVDAPQSLNGYSYANNTPVTTSDPTGMCAEVDCPAHGVTPVRNTSTVKQKPSSGNNVHVGQQSPYTSDGSGGGDGDGGNGTNQGGDTVKAPECDRECQAWLESVPFGATPPPGVECGSTTAGSNCSGVPSKDWGDVGGSQLFYLWLLGLSPESFHFGPGDTFTEEIRKDHSMDAVRESIKKKILTGKMTGKGSFNEFASDGAWRLPDDLWNILVPDFISGREDVVEASDGKTGSETAAFLGSYTYEYKVRGSVHDGAASVDIVLKNNTNWTSATHWPGGMREYYDATVGKSLDAAGQVSGIGAEVSQTITWTETMLVTP
ncbi:RHS repeat-associated core domain-containing protein, partial [Streptomyces sp. NPDC006482]|uniref:RHS repeat-associated core domain-containing protein n=1 Tax=Streptomyces sp. NPDC006482 TaxID=3154306 RepID=UPI0033A80E66